MSDAWEEIQALQSKRISLREKLEKRKKEREDILNLELNSGFYDSPSRKSARIDGSPTPTSSQFKTEQSSEKEEIKLDPEIESILLNHLCDVTLSLPISSKQLCENIAKISQHKVAEQLVINLLHKFSTQQLISINELKDNSIDVTNADHAKLSAMVHELNSKLSEVLESSKETESKEFVGKECIVGKSDADDTDQDDILSLISKPTIKEKETKKVGEEILDLLSKPTAKERSLAERFRSQGGATVMEFCPHGTKLECLKSQKDCKKLHFKKIIQAHTDETLGDCSFLNTCFHMDSCKYVHYEVDNPRGLGRDQVRTDTNFGAAGRAGTVLYPPQWIQCDLRYFDTSVLGKFAVIMADPPWDIHMELPYGTLSDDEMRQLGVPQLQEDGLIFLWVTGRAMELGRECLKLWGYDRVDEIIWVKTNQLQRIIRTGRTGHWLNHGKEHCLVGLKGNPPNLNRGLDCDVIVAEVRATSHKPDEIYGIIERLSPGTRKIELFGRPHNIQPNWITLGNQVDGVRLVDPQLIEAFRKTYPNGNCMIPSSKPVT